MFLCVNLEMQEWRAKTMEILNHNKIWNPSEENSKLCNVFKLLLFNLIIFFYNIKLI